MTDQTIDHLSEAHAAAFSAFQREHDRLAPGGGALDSELVAAAVEAARPIFASYYEDKGAKKAEAERDALLRHVNTKLLPELAAAQLAEDQPHG